MKLTANRIAGILRQEGYRLTPQRHAILKAIAGSHDHLTPAEIYERTRLEYPAIGLVTVYRVINLLAELKLICRLNVGGDSQSYLMRRPTGHHHHLVCSQCGRAVDFDDCNLKSLEQRLSRETGFTIEGHLLEVHGLCPECCLTGSR
jgi:Fe2+ or Zn2+ uptake regulation protein